MRVVLPSLLAALLVLGGSTSASSKRPTADTRVESVGRDSLPASSSVRAPDASARQTEIFRILQGGPSALDPEVRQHLWAVAGSLADHDWQPPRVTIRTVVRD
jgi:hypothetical protein